ncbi:hypothetical protein WJX74_007181 [Apatococcus lobatus]|uniref:Timeless N-terminal domain-containing protein n=1 Tax=Apatococcus lobatus TaxID=904363 RepID=A0AAW1S3W4_9CHLO
MAGSNLDRELLLSVAGGLGSRVKSSAGSSLYTRSDDCHECLQDLQRFLREDDVETREAFFAINQSNICRTDICPLIEACSEDTKLVYSALKVATFLTMPVNPDSQQQASQIGLMQRAADAFVSSEALPVIVGLVVAPLERHPRMTEEDALIVQLVIAFLRNLVTLPDPPLTPGSQREDRAHLRARLMQRLMDTHALELLNLMAQHVHERPFTNEGPVLMEIYAGLFRGVKAQHLVSAPARLAQQQSRAAPAAPSATTASGPGSMEAAGARRFSVNRAGPISGLGNRDPLRDARQVRGAAGKQRHGRFGGVFVKRVGAQEAAHSVITGNPKTDTLPTVRAPQQPSHFQKRKAKEDPSAKPTLTTLVGLREGLEGLLDGGYNRLLGTVRKQLEPGMGISRLDRQDFLHFFFVSHLCTGYIRMQQEAHVKDKRSQHKENHPAEAGEEVKMQGMSPFLQISATMGWDTFSIVRNLWLSTIDLPTNSPEKDWGMQAASLRLLKEMLFTLDMAQLVGSSADRQASDRLQRRLLHDDQKESGLLPVLGRLIKGFNFQHQNRDHAVDLVEALHVVLRLLERLSSAEAGGFLVKRKAAVKAQRAKKAAPAEPAEGEEAASGHPDAGASANEGPAETAAEPASQAGAGSPAASGLHGRERHDPFEEAEMEELAEEKRRLTKEVAYDLLQRLRQELAFPAVVHFYTWLLRGYSTNGSFLNHCLLSFLKRIASSDALNLEPMLYQLSVLRIFHQMLGDGAFRKQPGSGPLLHFSTGIVRSIFKRLVPMPEPPLGTAEPRQHHLEGNEGEEAESRPSAEEQHAAEEERRKQLQAQEGLSCMMFVELLFWKNSREAMDVRNEYHWKPEPVRRVRGQVGFGADGDDSNEEEQSAQRHQFLPAQIERLTELWEEHGGPGASSKDVLTAIVTNFENGSVPKARIARQLKTLGLKRGALSSRQEEKVKEGWERWGQQRPAAQLIADSLGQGVKKSLVNKYLKKLGLRGQGKQSKGHGMAGLSDDEFSSGAASASGSGSDSEPDPAQDAAAGSKPGPRDKRSGSVSDHLSQGSIDCSEVLRDGQPATHAAEGDTAASDGATGVEQPVKGRDSGSKKPLEDGKADEVRTAQDKKKKRRRLSKRQPEPEGAQQKSKQLPQSAGIKKQSHRTSRKALEAPRGARKRQPGRGKTSDSSDHDDATAALPPQIAMSDDDVPDLVEEHAWGRHQDQQDQIQLQSAAAKDVTLTSSEPEDDEPEHRPQGREPQAKSLHVSERAQGASKAELNAPQRSPLATLQAAQEHQQNSNALRPGGTPPKANLSSPELKDGAAPQLMTCHADSDLVEKLVLYT